MSATLTCARLLCYFFGGYFSIDFLTMSSTFSASLVALGFSSVAMPRQTSDRVVVSRRSMMRLAVAV
jgi:hypothetical protein